MLLTNPERVASCVLFCKEKFFYQGLEHNGVQLPAAINFTHYTHGTGQVRSNTFVDRPWQLREFSPKICDCSTAFFAFTRFGIRVFSLKT
jgi:hypothetical protein